MNKYERNHRLSYIMLNYTVIINLYYSLVLKRECARFYKRSITKTTGSARALSLFLAPARSPQTKGHRKGAPAPGAISCGERPLAASSAKSTPGSLVAAPAGAELQRPPGTIMKRVETVGIGGGKSAIRWNMQCGQQKTRGLGAAGWRRLQTLPRWPARRRP